jgi:hypothetical protein
MHGCVLANLQLHHVHEVQQVDDVRHRSRGHRDQRSHGT